MFCNKCGNKIEGNEKFCKVCGNNLNNNYQPQNNNTEKQKNGLAIASLVIGIVSIVLSLLINVFIFPLAITGLILGIVNKNKCGQKTAGIILNSISMVISIIVLICISFIFVGVFNIFGNLYEDIKEDINSNPVNGVWNCKSFDGSGPSDDYIITLKLNDDYSFVWNKYEDELNNHVYGKYTYEDENKTNHSGDYSYYMIDLVGEEFVNNGVLQDQEYKSQYEMGINKEYGEAILMNVSTYNMYYCYLEY